MNTPKNMSAARNPGRPRKWWWVASVAVPVTVAVIAIVPSLLRPGGRGGGDVFHVTGTQWNGPVAFNSVTVIAEQARHVSGQELPADVVETLDRALKLVRSGEFDAAIPLLASAEKTVPVAALLNNLGAAYLGSGNVEKARGYFQKAMAADPNEKTARSNLDRVVGAKESSLQAETTLTVWPGVEAEVTRFENTGGMLTLEVTFRNVGSDAAEIFPVDPNRLIDETTGRSWTALHSGGLFITKKLNPGDTYLIWTKYLVGDPTPAQFTAVVPGVPKPFERIVLR